LHNQSRNYKSAGQKQSRAYTQKHDTVLKPQSYTRKKPVNERKGNKWVLIVLSSIVGSILFNTYGKLSEELVFRRIANSHIKFPIDSQFLHTSEQVLNNDSFLGTNFIDEVNTANPIMKAPVLTQEMPKLKQRIETLAAGYSDITSGVFVWDYTNGNYININADRQFPTASIIKLPVLCQLFRRAEAGLVDLNGKMKITEYYRTEGSGYLQYRPAGSEFSVPELAGYMIQNSDNTATNMLLSSIGGMEELNRALRQWGFSQTYMKTWLPDLNGTNVATPKDFGTILYNIDSPEFLSLQSRAAIIEIMSHVKNRSLIREGLPESAQFIHKTGDIGTMLGDAGIVTMPDGHKYIVVIMTERPWNSFRAKQFINDASKIIYNSIASKDY